MASAKIIVLDEIYALYEDITKTLNVACVRGCCECCTQHVTMTTLEGHRIVQYIHKNQPQIDLEKLVRHADTGRFQPVMTTNEFACYCIEGKETPAEESSASSAACLFLADDECTIYDARPFGCRCFFSSVRCSEQTYAVVDPLILTINTVFLQSIEQLDVGGFFGNIYDVLSSCTEGLCTTYISGKRPPRAQGPLHGDVSVGLAKNLPVPAFMIPPEDRDRIRPIVKALKDILGR